MPSQQPVTEAGSFSESGFVSRNGFNTRPSCGLRVKRWTLPVSSIFCSVFASALLIAPDPARAFATSFSSNSILGMNMSAILMLAIFGGAMSFALLSAFWMIRERTRVIAENRRLKVSLSELRATHDLNEALVKVPGQRVVVWKGVDNKPVVIGLSDDDKAMPSTREAFVAFGGWVHKSSMDALEACVSELRSDAVAFNLVVRNKAGKVIDAQGGTSGSFAFVRFTEIEGEREEYARLKADHDSLRTMFTTVENLLQQLPMPVWLRSNSGVLNWVNRAYAEAVEAKNPQDAVSRNVELFDSELRGRMQGLEKPGELLREAVPVTVSGDRRRLEIFSYRNETGGAGLAVDKSDLEQIRRKLDETSEGHAKVLDQIATAVAIFDGSKHLVFHNSGFQQLWKLDPAILEGRPGNGELLDAMRDAKLLPEHPDWRKWRDGQLSVYQALEPREEWWHLLDGQTLRVVATPRNEGGATWVFENVTERLALESNYNSLIRVQGETLDHLNDAVAVFGSNGKLRLFNPPLEQLWQTSDLVITEGLHVSRIMAAWKENTSSETDLETILGQITGFLETREDQRGRMNMRNGNTLEYSIVPLPDGQTMLRLLDITATVKFEEALKERAEALEASDLLKSKFIQHVSYELRAPLTSISGFGELLATPEIGSLNEKQYEYLDHINTSADVLCALVDDILDLASIDAGTMRLDQQMVSFSRSVEQVASAFEGPIGAKGLRLQIKAGKGSDELFADEGRLKQILFKLVSNAVNFSPDGGEVEVAGARVAGAYEVRILDQGPGIAPEERERIFDRFESRAATGRRQGTGLGLSLARGFVELHGGSITVEDGPKGGTCFVCTFPDETADGTARDEEREIAASKAA